MPKAFRPLFFSGVTLLGFGGVAVLSPSGPVLARSQEPALQAPAGRPASGQASHNSLGLGRTPDPAVAKRGEPLYKANCSMCHGADARGGVGPNLVRSVLVLHDDHGEEIGPLVKSGRGAMPAFPNLTEAETHDISEFLHEQVELAANRGLYQHADTMTSGDAAKGKAYFQANCAKCHSVTGDLTGIGAKYPQPTAMLARFVWPASRRRQQSATVTLVSGEKLTGTLTHYDDFVTSLQSASGAVSSWPTNTVKVEISEPLAGHRALLPRYSDDDLHNLTRYLLSVK